MKMQTIINILSIILCLGSIVMYLAGDYNSMIFCFLGLISHELYAKRNNE